MISIQNISKKICSTANKRYNNFIKEDCRRSNNQLNMLIDEVMQEQLENDARRLFRRKNKYNIEDDGKEIKLSNTEIDLLFEKKCLKNKSSKTTEIDIFGKRNNNILPECYILGECTFKDQKKLYHKISCFFNKVCIIANHLIEICEISHLPKPKFHLVIISMRGFPKNEAIKYLEENELKIPRNLTFAIEYIDFEIFKKLLKVNNIKIAKYKKYYSRFISNGNSVEG